MEYILDYLGWFIIFALVISILDLLKNIIGDIIDTNKLRKWQKEHAKYL